MHIKSELTTKIKNDVSLRRLSAFKPRISLIVTFWPVDFGGVLGKKKQYIPMTIEAPAAIFKGMDVSSIFNKATSQPAAIQPIVPRTRILGNSLLASSN